MKTPNLSYRLLNHPFYESWNEGKVSKEKLAQYAKSYLELVYEVPMLWEKVINSFGEKSEMAVKVIAEEKEHIGLWEKWQRQIPADKSPSLKMLIETLHNMTPSALLGAIHSFEIQQPEVAKSKKEGLINHYGFSVEDLQYFDEHMQEKEHIQFGHNLALKYADSKEFRYGFENGSKHFYDALDLFLSENQKEVA